MNSSIQRHYYAERGAEGRIGKRGEEEEEEEDEDEGKVVDAEHLAKVCLVNRLIPSPPKSNH